MRTADQIPNAHPVEYAYAWIWDSWTEYGALIGTIKHYGITVVPDDWVPWFIWDLGLEDVVPYIRDYRTVLAAGPAWPRTRGTPDGIATGISFVQSSGVVAASDQRHNWWEFQVAFAEPASDLDQIQQLDGIIRLSKAAEDELFRMYSPGYDFRPVRMDMHRADDGLMDGYSGEPLWEDGPLIAFGWSGSYELPVEPILFSAAEVTVGDLTVLLGCAYRFQRVPFPMSMSGRSASWPIRPSSKAWRRARPCLIRATSLLPVILFISFGRRRSFSMPGLPMPAISS